ncbi:MAG: DMT family transporter [Cyanobacteria bacterium J06598_1]
MPISAFNDDSAKPDLRIVYFKLVATALLWGGTFIAGRVAVQTLGPFTAAFLRFAIASLALGIVVWRVHGEVPALSASERLAVVGLGLTGIFGYNALFFAGLKTVEAGRASLIIALNPVAIALGASLLFKAPLNKRKILGVVISLFGTAWVISRGEVSSLLALLLGDSSVQSFGWGEAMIGGCVLTWMSYTLMGKAVMRTLSPLVASTYACWAGTCLLLPVAIAEGLWQSLGNLHSDAALSVLYLGVFGSAVGFCWYYDGLQAIGPAKASAFINLVPVSAIGLAALFLHEPLTPSIAIGAILVILGVSITNRA